MSKPPECPCERRSVLAVPGVPDSSGLSEETLAEIAKLQVTCHSASSSRRLHPHAATVGAVQEQKAEAVAAEDFDLAKKLKAKITELSTPPEPEETEEERHKKRVSSALAPCSPMCLKWSSPCIADRSRPARNRRRARQKPRR